MKKKIPANPAEVNLESSNLAAEPEQPRKQILKGLEPRSQPEDEFYSKIRKCRHLWRERRKALESMAARLRSDFRSCDPSLLFRSLHECREDAERELLEKHGAVIGGTKETGLDWESAPKIRDFDKELAVIRCLLAYVAPTLAIAIGKETFEKHGGSSDAAQEACNRAAATLNALPEYLLDLLGRPIGRSCKTAINCLLTAWAADNLKRFPSVNLRINLPPQRKDLEEIAAVIAELAEDYARAPGFAFRSWTKNLKSITGRLGPQMGDDIPKHGLLTAIARRLKRSPDKESPLYDGPNILKRLGTEDRHLTRLEAQEQIANLFKEATPSQKQLLGLLADGHNLEEAAALLEIGPSTVRAQLHRLRTKASPA